MDLMKSAKSLIDSLITLASLACGALGLTRAPDLGGADLRAGIGGSFAVGFGARRLPTTGDFGRSEACLSLPLPKKFATMGEPSGVDRAPKLLCLGSNGLSGISYFKLASARREILNSTYINTAHVRWRQGILKGCLAANKLLECLPLILNRTGALFRRANRSELVRLDG